MNQQLTSYLKIPRHFTQNIQAVQYTPGHLPFNSVDFLFPNY